MPFEITPGGINDAADIQSDVCCPDQDSPVLQSLERDMADVITELRRPSTLGAFVFAVIGWLLLIWSFAQSSSDQDALRAQLSQAQKLASQLADELKTERSAAGALADITGKRDAAEAQRKAAEGAAGSAVRLREEAQSGLADLSGKLKAATDEKAGIDRAVADAAAQRGKVMGDLDVTRQQLETVKQAFARASDQLAQKNSELAGLNDKIQKAQESLTQAANAQTAASKALEQAQDGVRQTLSERDEVEKAVAAAKTRQAAQALESQNVLDSLGKQISAAKDQLAALEKSIAEKQKSSPEPSSPQP